MEYLTISIRFTVYNAAFLKCIIARSFPQTCRSPHEYPLAAVLMIPVDVNRDHCPHTQDHLSTATNPLVAVPATACCRLQDIPLPTTDTLVPHLKSSNAVYKTHCSRPSTYLYPTVTSFLFVSAKQK